MPPRSRKKTRRRIRAVGERFLVGLGSLLLPLLPRRAIVGLSRLLGQAAFRGSRRYRTIGLQNLELVYGDRLTSDQKKDLLLQAFCSFSLLLLDLFWFRRHSRERIRTWVRVEDSLRDGLSDGRQICLTAHYGNWEVLGQTVAFLGHRLASVATPVADKRVNRAFNQSRGITGQEVIPRQGAIRSMLKVLREEGKVALLLDQNVKPSEGGRFVEFFGRPVPVSEAGAALALRTRSPVFFAFCIPQPDGSYRAFGTRTLLPPPAESRAVTPEAVARLTQDILSTVEEQVRRDPAYWHWFYKRWKHRPPDADPGDFPPYARPLRPAEAERLRRTLAKASSPTE